MAAAAVVALKGAAKRRLGEDRNKNRISFHLQLQLGDYVGLPPGKTSVGWLRSPLQSEPQGNTEESGKSSKTTTLQIPKYNIGTRFEVWAKKFNNKWEQSETAMWQERFLIATERRLFIVSRKDSNPNPKSPEDERLSSTVDIRDEDLEIVDSIPFDEVISVDLNIVNDSKPWDTVFEPANKFYLKKILQELFRIAVEFFSLDNKQNLKNASREAMVSQARCVIESVQNQLSSEEVRQQLTADKTHFDSVLRIVTDPEGFNRGAPYYFVLRKGTLKTWKGTLHWKQAREGLTRTLSHWQLRRSAANRASARPLDQTVAKKLRTLAARRRRDAERETRFLRLQARLQEVWDSVPFNLAVLFLIVSNFVFTVQQLENRDPARQRYFEVVDLTSSVGLPVYRVICSAILCAR
jgi:hypothetical protein